MNIAQTLTLADGMHGGGIGAGWWIVMVPVMLLFMGGMMWMMMRGMGGGSESPETAESPLETLDRRLADGEISVEEYRSRREALSSESADHTSDGAS